MSKYAKRFALKYNEDVLKKTVQRCKERNIIIPTFAQQKDPSLIPAKIKTKLQPLGLWDVNPLNLFRITWHNNVDTGLYGDVNYLELPVGMLTGFMFPISLLPGWAQWLAFLTPMVWAFKGLTIAIQPDINFASLWQNWLMAFGIACVYLIGTFFLSKRVEDMIRVTGELSSV